MTSSKHFIEDPSQQKSLPCRVIIIAGFLGSGKTTLLKHLLEWEINQGRRPFVIMSEFGDIDIDRVLVADNKIALTSIVGGCACCNLREELAGSLQAITRQAPGATVFIKSTGVGDPAGIVEAIKPLIENGTVVVKNVIVIYDARRDLLLSKDSQLIKRQLETADIIIINKSDLLSPDEIKDAVDHIAEINPMARLSVTSHCSIDIEEALQHESTVKSVTGIKSTSATFRSFGFQIEEPLSQKALEKWLRNLPSGVIRTKGFVKLDGQKGLFEVQATHGFVKITPFPVPNDIEAILILVAHPMRTDGLVKGLQKCVATKPG